MYAVLKRFLSGRSRWDHSRAVIPSVPGVTAVERSRSSKDRDRGSKAGHARNISLSSARLLRRLLLLRLLLLQPLLNLQTRRHTLMSSRHASDVPSPTQVSSQPSRHDHAALLLPCWAWRKASSVYAPVLHHQCRWSVRHLRPLRSKGCHTDKNCNLYPWRVIDAFC
jgi:hypothetical protein